MWMAAAMRRALYGYSCATPECLKSDITAACSHSRMPVITTPKPVALGEKTAAMKKGAAVGAGRVCEWQPASDPCLLGATPLPAPPRRVGLQAFGRPTVLRRRGLGLGTVGAGFAAGSGRGRGRATRDLSRH